MNEFNTVAPNLMALKNFIPSQQRAFMARLARESEEGQYFIDQIAELAERVNNMPVTYQTDKIGINDKKIVLHYFTPGMDWYIVEKDMEGDEGQFEAFGLADIGFGISGLGYISIDEIMGLRGCEIDLNWTPCTIAAMKARKY